ncbi:hypothetical protein GCM10009585_12320 [Brevibacterium paucivorans]|uniref:hypothetical protein n=1 Tax=Brevibacterium paucivorans TaxID=170994 RepID=UPI0031E256A9
MTAYVHRRLLALCAVGALVLTGCSESLPQTEAAPHPSTQEESPTPDSEPIPEFDVPEYTTDLDLTAEEMLATEEALIGLQRYIFVSEQVMKSGGEDTLHIDSVSVGEAKEGLEETATDFRNDHTVLFGKLVTQDLHVHEMDLRQKETKETAVSACLPKRTWGIRKANENESEADYEDPYQMIWTLQKHGSTWKVSLQELYSEHC